MEHSLKRLTLSDRFIVNMVKVITGLVDLRNGPKSLQAPETNFSWPAPHSWILTLCLGLFVWNKIRWKNFSCLLFYTRVYRPVKHVGGVALFVPTVSRCLQHCYNIVPHCRDIWETMFDPCSNRILINLVTVVKSWQDKVLLICTIIVSADKQEDATLYKCLCMWQQLFRNHFVSKYSKLQ